MGNAITVSDRSVHKPNRLATKICILTADQTSRGQLYLNQSGCNLFHLATRKGEQVATATN